MRSLTRLIPALGACWLAGFSGPGRAAAAEAPSSFTLPNGLSVRFVSVPAPLQGEKKVAVLLGVRAGFFDEPPGWPHIAHVTEHVVFEPRAGTDEGHDVARWMRAGSANGETLPGFLYFDLDVPPDDLARAIRVQAARLGDAAAAVSDTVLQREIPRTLAEVEFLERPGSYHTGKFAFCAFVQAALHGQAEVPLKARTREVRVEDVRRFSARTFRPDRARLLLVGDFDRAEARQRIESRFGTIPRPTTEPGRFEARPPAGPITARWDVATRHLLLAWRAPLAPAGDHAALTLASTALAQRLSLDEDLAALARSPLVLNEVEGFFVVNVQAPPGADLDALRTRLLDHVHRLSQPEGFTDAQVRQARQLFAQTVNPSPLQLLILSARSSPLMARTNVELQRLMREIVWGDLDAYTKQVETLDGPQVRQAIAHILKPSEVIEVRVEPRSSTVETPARPRPSQTPGREGR